MASTSLIEKQLDHVCPNCGGPFAQDRKNRGFARHRFYGALNRLGLMRDGVCVWARGLRDHYPLAS